MFYFWSINKLFCLIEIKDWTIWLAKTRKKNKYKNKKVWLKCLHEEKMFDYWILHYMTLVLFYFFFERRQLKKNNKKLKPDSSIIHSIFFIIIFCFQYFGKKKVFWAKYLTIWQLSLWHFMKNNKLGAHFCLVSFLKQFDICHFDIYQYWHLY